MVVRVKSHINGNLKAFFIRVVQRAVKGLLPEVTWPLHHKLGIYNIMEDNYNFKREEEEEGEEENVRKSMIDR